MLFHWDGHATYPIMVARKELARNESIFGQKVLQFDRSGSAA